MSAGQRKTVVRHRQLVALRKAGLSYRTIGVSFGISGERVRQILNDTKQEDKASKERDFLRTGDVARLLNIHVNTVRRWGESGILKQYRIGSRRDRRFRREDVERLYAMTSSG